MVNQTTSITKYARQQECLNARKSTAHQDSVNRNVLPIADCVGRMLQDKYHSLREAPEEALSGRLKLYRCFG